ncbi:MAG: EI24 domain-containing protein [Proteobacteria bacterium]|nr:EI24 domain-containing protein [Pseudomonadota bacterium]
MNAAADATWRALAYCWHPRTLLWSLLPLGLAAGAAFGLGWFGWEPAVAAVRRSLEASDLLGALFEWLDAVGAPDLRPVLAPMIVVAIVLPAIVLLTLLLVVWIMTPAMVAMVVRRRFPGLQRSPGAAGGWAALAWSLACSLMAVLALILSVPLWFVPPLVLVLPPLIWGWLCYRVLAFDTLARHADAAERRFILHQHRWPLRAAGLLCGLLGVLPSLLWALGASALIVAPLLMPLLVWLYTAVFAFATLWFAHFTLAALHRLRAARAVIEESPA